MCQAKKPRELRKQHLEQNKNMVKERLKHSEKTNGKHYR
jgi:hypothetical protein